MSFELTPAQVSAVDQVQSGVSEVIKKLTELTPEVLSDTDGNREKALLILSLTVKSAMIPSNVTEIIIAELVLREYEKRTNA